jgi:hypothetical protein
MLANRQRLQRYAKWFHHLFASAASVPACMAQVWSMLQQQWAQRTGPGEPATSIAVGQVVHQARQQVQRYKWLLLQCQGPLQTRSPAMRTSWWACLMCAGCGLHNAWDHGHIS